MSAFLVACLSSASFFTSQAYAYEQVPFVKPVTENPGADARVNVDANNIAYDGKSKIATATGTVVITYGRYTLKATKVVYDQEKDILRANGQVELTEPNGNVIIADNAEIRDRFKEGFARHLKALLSNDTTITAEYAVRQNGNIMIFEKARYTACKDCLTKSGQPVWEVRSSKTVHDEKKLTLYHTNPTLRIAGVPVGWLPYASQPDPQVKRRSGFLLPSFKIGSTYAFGVVTPYFLELGKSADLTFRPMWTVKQGPVADVEYRQRLASGHFNIRGMGLRQFNPSYAKVHKHWRGALRSHGEFQINNNWDWGWDGTLVSDRRFLDNYGYDGTDLLTNQVYLTGLDDRNYFSAKVMEFHTLAKKNYNTRTERQRYYPSALPYIDTEYTLGKAILGGEVTMDWNAYYIRRDDANSPFPTIEHAKHQLRSVSTLKWQRQMVSHMGAIFTPFARVRSDIYVTKHLPDSRYDDRRRYRKDKTTTRVLPSAGIDVRWPFMANYSLGQSIITPVFQAVAATNERDRHRIGNEDAISINFDNTSIFLNDRFTGEDRYEGGSRLNAGLLYSFLGANGSYARMSVGESFHVAGKNSFDRESGLGKHRSNLVGAVVVQPWSNLSLSYQARVKEDLSKLHMQEALASYNQKWWSSSIGYIYLDSEETAGRWRHARQIEAASSVRLTEAWSLYSGLKYDLIHDNFRYRTVGLKFDCDCMTATVSYSQYRGDAVTAKTDHRFLLSVDLRTLGATSISGGP